MMIRWTMTLMLFFVPLAQACSFEDLNSPYDISAPASSEPCASEWVNRLDQHYRTQIQNAPAFIQPRLLHAHQAWRAYQTQVCLDQPQPNRCLLTESQAYYDLDDTHRPVTLGSIPVRYWDLLEEQLSQQSAFDQTTRTSQEQAQQAEESTSRLFESLEDSNDARSHELANWIQSECKAYESFYQFEVGTPAPGGTCLTVLGSLTVSLNHSFYPDDLGPATELTYSDIGGE